MSQRRRDAAGGVIAGKLYVVGGIADDGIELSSTEVYDPGTNRWSSRAPMPGNRSHAAAAVASGRLYVIAGLDPLMTKVEAYTP